MSVYEPISKGQEEVGRRCDRHFHLRQTVVWTGFFFRFDSRFPSFSSGGVATSSFQSFQPRQPPPSAKVQSAEKNRGTGDPCRFHASKSLKEAVPQGTSPTSPKQPQPSLHRPTADDPVVFSCFFAEVHRAAGGCCHPPSGREPAAASAPLDLFPKKGPTRGGFHHILPRQPTTTLPIGPNRAVTASLVRRVLRAQALEPKVPSSTGTYHGHES